MGAVVELKSSALDDFQVTFEVVPPVDISELTVERRKAIVDGLEDTEKQLKLVQDKISELNSEIDKLTCHADEIDYAVAVISGVIAGMIDSFFVGETDIDKDKIQEVLEKKYHTANDSAYKHKDKDGHWTSSAMYHRLDDLAHHPTLGGLVASILVRYFRLVIFIDGSDGKPHVFFADTSSSDMLALEKKQLQMALALLSNPEIIIIEEPFKWLDKQNEKKLIMLLQRLRDQFKKTIIVSSQDSEILYKYTNTMLFIKNGNIVLTGPTKDCYIRVDFLKKNKFHIPEIVEFTHIAKKNKDVKIDYHKDVRDIIKDIYKHI